MSDSGVMLTTGARKGTLDTMARHLHTTHDD